MQSKVNGNWYVRRQLSHGVAFYFGYMQGCGYYVQTENGRSLGYPSRRMSWAELLEWSQAISTLLIPIDK